MANVRPMDHPLAIYSILGAYRVVATQPTTGWWANLDHLQ